MGNTDQCTQQIEILVCYLPVLLVSIHKNMITQRMAKISAVLVLQEESMKQFDIMFCGHVCLDITPAFPREKRALSDVFRAGKLISVGGATVSLGGSVSNSGAASSKLGLRTLVNTRVGNDDFGQTIRELFHRYTLTQKISSSDEGSTSYSIVLSVPGNDRIFLHNTGTNDLFMPEDVDYDAAKNSRIFHFGYPPLMKNMYEQPELLVQILKRVHEQNTAVSLDMALPDPTAPAGQKDWHAILSQIMPYVDIFVPSFEELLLMLDRERYEELNREAAGRDIIAVMKTCELTRLSDRLLEMGVGILVIKCGLKGYYIRTASAERMEKIPELGLAVSDWADREFICQAIDTENVVSATGAGDSSIAGFLCALLHGKTPEQCAKSAVSTAHFCLQTVDAASGIPDFSEVFEVAQSDMPEVSHMDETQGKRVNGVWLLKKDIRFDS